MVAVLQRRIETAFRKSAPMVAARFCDGLKMVAGLLHHDGDDAVLHTTDDASEDPGPDESNHQDHNHADQTEDVREEHVDRWQLH